MFIKFCGLKGADDGSGISSSGRDESDVITLRHDTAQVFFRHGQGPGGGI